MNRRKFLQSLGIGLGLLSAPELAMAVKEGVDPNIASKVRHYFCYSDGRTIPRGFCMVKTNGKGDVLEYEMR